MALATGVMGAGNFSFDVTSSADNNWIKIPTLAAHRLTTAHTYSTWATPGVDGTAEDAFTRDLVGTDRNWRLQDGGGDAFSATASSGGSPDAGYAVAGGTSSAGTQTHLAVAFASASSSILYLGGVSTATDSTVAATNDPNTGVRIGCRSDGSNTCAAGGDWRGSLDEVLLYNVKLGAPEMAMLGASRNALRVRRLSRQPVLRMSMMGRPGVAMGSNVPDHSRIKAHGDGSAGTDPTYTVSFLRGHR
jgi:hypothetical protein